MKSKNIVRTICVGALALWFCGVIWAGPPKDKGPTSSKLSGEEISKHWKKLKKKGWDKGDMEQALAYTKGERALFEKYVSLRAKKVPPKWIKRSFARCEGNPKLVGEYWQWVLQYNFSPQEVDEVFEVLPLSNPIGRWYYFAYRAGASQKNTKPLNARKEKKNPKGKFSQEEVLGIFKRTRFDLNLIHEYFNKRHAGKSVPEAWKVVKEKVEKQIAEEEKKKQEKLKAEREKQRKKEEARRKMRERMAEQRRKKMKEEQGEPAETVSLKGLDDLLGGEGDKEEKKEAAEEEKDDDEKEEKKDSPEKKAEDDDKAEKKDAEG